MACDKPTGDCTVLSSCADCGCGSPSAEPVLPRCQDVSLVPGAYRNATVVVNAAGCISEITEGEPELYTPDECCGQGGGEGEGTGGGRGNPGPPGPAATIGVETTISESGTAWTVQNIGTSSAAIFRFTAPAATSGGGSTPSGATGIVSGMKVEAGAVTVLPEGLVTRITAQPDGTNADSIIFVATESTTNPGRYTITLNLDLFHASLRNEFLGLHNTQADQIENLQSALADAVNALATQQQTLATLQGALATQQGAIAELTDEVGDLRQDFNNHIASGN